MSYVKKAAIMIGPKNLLTVSNYIEKHRYRLSYILASGVTLLGAWSGYQKDIDNANANANENMSKQS